jgi:hypothetical protein
MQEQIIDIIFFPFKNKKKDNKRKNIINISCPPEIQKIAIVSALLVEYKKAIINDNLIFCVIFLAMKKISREFIV